MKGAMVRGRMGRVDGVRELINRELDSLRMVDG